MFDERSAEVYGENRSEIQICDDEGIGKNSPIDDHRKMRKVKTHRIVLWRWAKKKQIIIYNLEELNGHRKMFKIILQGTNIFIKMYINVIC